MFTLQTSVKSQRIFFAAVPIAYCLFLAGIATYRSADRRSILSQSVFKDSPTISASESLSGVESKVQMRDFVRYEMTHGRLGWEVKATDAKIYVNDGTSHIDNARLVLHREKGEADVKIFANSAQLETAKSVIQKALLFGNVRIEQGDSMHMTTETAEYDVVNKLVRSPTRVAVVGSGFEVFGDRMEFPLDEQQFSLSGNVTSRFEPGLKPPESLNIEKKP